MEKKDFKTVMLEKVNKILDDMKNHPETVTDNDRSMLDKLYSSLCKTTGISEHTQWRVKWKVEKWKDHASRALGLEPYEVCTDTENIVLDAGANEILKLISGTGGTPYDSANAYIYVGTDSSIENAAQTGLLAANDTSHKFAAKMDVGYPVVTGRQVEYQATFGEGEAIFSWNEAAIVNGPMSSANAISLNRKQINMGTKTIGEWAINITISVTSN